VIEDEDRGRRETRSARTTNSARERIEALVSEYRASGLTLAVYRWRGLHGRERSSPRTTSRRHVVADLDAGPVALDARSLTENAR